MTIGKRECKRRRLTSASQEEMHACGDDRSVAMAVNLCRLWKPLSMGDGEIGWGKSSKRDDGAVPSVWLLSNFNSQKKQAILVI